MGYQERLTDHHESLRVNVESLMVAMLLFQNSLVTVLLFNNICRYLQQKGILEIINFFYA